MRVVGPPLLSSLWRIDWVSCVPLCIALSRDWLSEHIDMRSVGQLALAQSSQEHGGYLFFIGEGQLSSMCFGRVYDHRVSGMMTMAALPAVVPPVADPSVYIVT